MENSIHTYNPYLEVNNFGVADSKYEKFLVAKTALEKLHLISLGRNSYPRPAMS